MIEREKNVEEKHTNNILSRVFLYDDAFCPLFESVIHSSLKHFGFDKYVLYLFIHSFIYPQSHDKSGSFCYT